MARKTVPVLILLCIILGLLFLMERAKKKKQELPEFTYLPEFTVTTIDNEKFSNKDFFGTVGIISFVASWCGPCRLELSQINDLAKKYRNLAVLAITYESIELIKPLADSLGLIFPFGTVDSTVFTAFGVDKIPYRFLVKDKIIIDEIYGAPVNNDDEFTRKLIEVLSLNVDSLSSSK